MDASEQAILDETPKREARQRRSVEEKRRILEETLESEASAAGVALRTYGHCKGEMVASFGVCKGRTT
jgi:hypothetical protein